jgi:hypothetical protein
MGEHPAVNERRETLLFPRERPTDIVMVIDLAPSPDDTQRDLTVWLDEADVLEVDDG